MLNLLPPWYKEELKDEKNFRLTLILGILVLLFFVSLALLLLSIRIYMVGQIQAQKILVESQLEDYGDEDPVKRIRELNRSIAETSSFYQEQIVFADVIDRVTGVLPEEIYLTSFHYTPVKSTGEEGEKIVAGISLNGVTPTTDDLLVLKENIENDNTFSRLAIPPETWKDPGAIDIEFSMSFEIDSSVDK